MYRKFRRKMLELASTRRPVAASVGMLLGVGGVLRGRRGSVDHLKSTWSLATKSSSIAGRPMSVTIEPTNVCNLDCPVCETGAGILGREKGHMSLARFQHIIDKIGGHTNTLVFYFMGEPFLNKSAYAMIRYAKDAGVPFIETCTNGDFVDPEKLVDCGLSRVSFQIGGLSQETHEVYRVKGRLDRVMRNLKETIRIRNERQSPLVIEVGLILMKHNEHEISRFESEMKTLGVDRTVVIDPCVRTIDQGKQFLPADRKHWAYDEAAFSDGILRPRILPDNVCPWIYYSIAIHVSGNVVPCCRDPLGTEVMGNIFTQSLDEIWNGPKFQDLRERVNRDQGSVAICRLCSSYPVGKIN